MIPKVLRPDVVPFVEILLVGPLAAQRPSLTAAELSRCVDLLGRGRTLQQVFDTIQAERPTLPFDAEASS
jgi:hypothetical protein